MSRAAALGYRGELQARGAELLQTFRNSSAVVARIPAELAPELRRLSFVNYVEAESFGHAGQSSAQDTSWGVHLIGAPTVWSSTNITGQNAHITILDTGVDSVHRWNLARDGPADIGLDCLYVGTVANTCYQEYTHGSHVAGIANARNNDTGTIGVAYAASGFSSVRICAANGACSQSAMATALDWTTSNGYARQIVNVSIQSCTVNSTIAEAVARSISDGNIVVAIAGNTTYEGTSPLCVETEVGSTGVTWPGRYPDVLTVSGSLPGDAFAAPNTPPCIAGSRYGPQVELAAPFWTTNAMSVGGQWEVDEVCGTSYAAPVVVAVAALVWSYYPTWTASNVRCHLCNTAVQNLGDADHFGCGRVSAYNAIFVPFNVTPQVPGVVQTEGTKQLIGSADWPAAGWQWERRDEGGQWTNWSNQQNSSFYASPGEYTIEWRLSATRLGIVTRVDSTTRQTRVCIPFSESCLQ